MNQYEIAVLFDSQLEIDMSKPTAKLEKIIADNSGKIVKTDNWGKKKLAYPIAGQDHALYVFYQVELLPESVAKIEATLNITDEVIRFMIIRPDLRAIAKAEEAKAEKAKKAAERGDDATDEADKDREE
jgi:small subunit ribosomal protein S6